MVWKKGSARQFCHFMVSTATSRTREAIFEAVSLIFLSGALGSLASLYHIASHLHVARASHNMAVSSCSLFTQQLDSKGREAIILSQSFLQFSSETFLLILPCMSHLVLESFLRRSFNNFNAMDIFFETHKAHAKHR